MFDHFYSSCSHVTYFILMSIIIIITISIIWMLILNYYITLFYTWYYLLYLKYFDIFTYPLAVLRITLPFCCLLPIFLCFFSIYVLATCKWVKVFKKGPCKICGRQKIWSDMVCLSNLPQILQGTFMNTLTQTLFPLFRQYTEQTFSFRDNVIFVLVI